MNKIANPETELLPMLPLRGIIVFPDMLLNFDVERNMSVSALNAALSSDQMVFLAPQKDIAQDSPKAEDLYKVGTICKLKQLLRVPGTNAVRVLVEGKTRARIVRITSESPCFYAEVEPVKDPGGSRLSVKAEALIRNCCAMLDEYAQLTGFITPEMILNVTAADNPGYVADYVAQNIYLKYDLKQKLLEEPNPVRRLSLLNNMLQKEINVLVAGQRIREAAHEQMNKGHRDYFLREQLKAIRRELGEGEDEETETDDYREKIKAIGFAPETETKLLKDVTRLSKQPFGSSEAAVLQNYLDICLDMPWNTRTVETLEIAEAKKVLDSEHYGIEKVKERILEFLAVKKLSPSLKGGVLCLVGPPGVGKTSIALSIAKATNRKSARISLGGVHDEAEIRGHRRTYVGAMPGRIVSGIQQAKSSNPVIVLDEVDKMGSDYRGDPASALLEVFDSEQNHSFRDHYLEIPLDLSDVLFITTANTVDTMPKALLDRMEVIQLGSYTDEEKLRIAKDHLLPKQRKKHGLNAGRLKADDGAIREVITLYTRESGVRILERELATLCRKTAKLIAAGERKSVTVRAGHTEDYLGTPKYKPDSARTTDEVGLVRGLAWTSTGGEVLDVEVGVSEGTGKLELTGNLGDIMKESAKAAITYIRSRAARLGIDPEFHKNRDIHIHFPEGAVPKDGPSAGTAICMAVISALSGVPVRRDTAMTGEITLRGRILPVGGLKEKTMAALRSGISTVIIPAENEKDLRDIDKNVRAALNFITADHADKILDKVLNREIISAGAETLHSGKADELLPAGIVKPEKGKPVSIRQ
ncbi:MAG: endopeptidase La [Oscillospiraceae bacterium]|nr:endopeptidase La [Oscillospiraceae bacterium]